MEIRPTPMFEHNQTSPERVIQARHDRTLARFLVRPFADFSAQFSYLIVVPILMTYTLGFAVIKYEESYITLPSGAGMF
jgi:hypothetical protein